MGSAYDLSHWREFAAGLAGATAALTGLVFVAVSIHLEEVLADQFHRRRAESTFISLLLVLGGALVLLLPGLPREVYGVLCILAALPLLRRATRSVFILRRRGARGEPWITLGAAILADVLLLTGGIGLIARGAGGLYVVAVALMLMAARAMSVVWVLFVSLSQPDASEQLSVDGG